MSDEQHLLRAEHLATFLSKTQAPPDDPKPVSFRRHSVHMIFAVVAVLGLVGLGIGNRASAPPPLQQAHPERSKHAMTRELVAAAPVANSNEGPPQTMSHSGVNKRAVDRSQTNRQTSEPVTLAARDRVKQPVSARGSRDRGVMPAMSAEPARREPSLPVQETVAIEPYRNGTMAKRLTGEPLRLALIEDRRLTKKMNEAALREIRAAQLNDERSAERP